MLQQPKNAALSAEFSYVEKNRFCLFPSWREIYIRMKKLKLNGHTIGTWSVYFSYLFP